MNFSFFLRALLALVIIQKPFPITLILIFKSLNNVVEHSPKVVVNHLSIHPQSEKRVCAAVIAEKEIINSAFVVYE